MAATTSSTASPSTVLTADRSSRRFSAETSAAGGGDPGAG